ncbi:MAG: GNAT family N-acetyltransferase [Bacteroidales bacterium]|nr:GNAT family N-acetyltransferase [Bacteroidales bacterium]
MIRFIELSESGHRRFAEDLFEDAFPLKERPKFDVVEDREENNFHFLVVTNDDDPIGIFTYWNFPEFNYIEHFAIAPEFRGQGMGKATMLNFMLDHPEQVVLEIELPDTEQAEHRLEFYTDLGFTRQSQEYVQPSYHGDKTPEVPMIIMTKYELDDGEFEEITQVLYEKVYHRRPKMRAKERK